FYIVNAILVKGDRQLAETLAARPDVARVTGNPHIHNNLPERGPIEESPLQPGAPATIEPGITYTHAPDVWSLGFRGETILIAGADTGIRWTHDALKPHYRGWDGVNANHNFNWHDSIHDSIGNPCGNDSPEPCDDYFHGSHTIGTAIGDDGGTNQIGMAPGAKWIGCRNMDEGDGTPARYIECMEFFLAPAHIAGAMALLWSAIPSLQHQIQASRDALNSTTVQIQDASCGDPTPPNNVYGWGRINIAAAVGTPPPTPTVSPTPVSSATP